jgi:hypothetical protein
MKKLGVVFFCVPPSITLSHWGAKACGSTVPFIYSEIEGGIYVHGGCIDIHDSIELKRCECL